MHIAKEDVPVKIDAPGAMVRLKRDFGDATGYGKISGEYFSLAAGTDIAPLLRGLEGDLCQAPHWGYLIEGEVAVTYGDGQQEVVRGGDLFHWPPGHTVKVTKDTDMILFSPQHQHEAILDHIRTNLS